MMFGLFLVTYDWNEWRDLIALSSSKEKLTEHWATEMRDYPLVSAVESGKLVDLEEKHYIIERVDVIE